MTRFCWRTATRTPLQPAFHAHLAFCRAHSTHLPPQYIPRTAHRTARATTRTHHTLHAADGLARYADTGGRAYRRQFLPRSVQHPHAVVCRYRWYISFCHLPDPTHTFAGRGGGTHGGSPVAGCRTAFERFAACVRHIYTRVLLTCRIASSAAGTRDQSFGWTW